MADLGSNVDPAIWAMVEMGIGIVSACLPTLRPVLHLITHGGIYEREASDDHLQKGSRGNKSKRDPFAWLFSSSLQLSQVRMDKLTPKDLTEADERV